MITLLKMPSVLIMKLSKLTINILLFIIKNDIKTIHRKTGDYPKGWSLVLNKDVWLPCVKGAGSCKADKGLAV